MGPYVLNKSIIEDINLNPHDFSLIFASCGKQKLRHDTYLSTLARASERVLPLFKPSEITTYLWGFAKLRLQPGNVIMGHIIKEVEFKSSCFSSTELCILLWSFATLSIYNKNFLKYLTIELNTYERIVNLKTYCISNIIWAYGKLINDTIPKYQPALRIESLLFNMLAQAQKTLQHFRPKELVKLIYAVAVLNHVDSTLFMGLAKKINLCIKYFSTSELVLLIWSFGKVKYSHQPLLKNLTKELIIRIKYSKQCPLKPVDIANLLKGFARLSYMPGELMPLLIRKSLRSIRLYHQQEMSNLMFACAKLDYIDYSLIYGVITEIIRRKRNGEVFNDRYIQSINNSCENIGIDILTALTNQTHKL